LQRKTSEEVRAGGFQFEGFIGPAQRLTLAVLCLAKMAAHRLGLLPIEAIELFEVEADGGPEHGPQIRRAD